MFRTSTLLIVIAIAFVVGCGSGLDLEPVRGKILVNGQPYPNAKVVSYPDEGTVASDKTNEDGEFTLRTSGEVGALRGRHTITVSPDADEPVPTPGQPIVMLKVPYDAKYRDPRRSTLKYEVAGDVILTIDLTAGTVSAD
jgi:hypothetical protein